MAETQEASIGYGGEFWLATDDTVGTLTELVQVVSFQEPDIEVDEVETTHLQSPDGYKEYTEGLRDGGEIEIVFNYRPGSDTDEMLEDWKAERPRTKRKVRMGIPLQGTVVKTHTASAVLRGYSGGTIAAGDRMEGTLRIRITGPVTVAAV